MLAVLLCIHTLLCLAATCTPDLCPVKYWPRRNQSWKPVTNILL